MKIILLRYYLLCVHFILILFFLKFYFIFKLSDGNGGTVRLVLFKKKILEAEGDNQSSCYCRRRSER